MIITNEFKLTKTYDGTRSILAHHRPAIEVDSFTEEPLTLKPGETKDIFTEKGVVLVSTQVIPITGDITVSPLKYFVCFSPLNITITNGADNEEDLKVRAYIF